MDLGRHRLCRRDSFGGRCSFRCAPGRRGAAEKRLVAGRFCQKKKAGIARALAYGQDPAATGTPLPKNNGNRAADKDFLSRINKMRALEKEQLIGGRDIQVYGSVLQKFQNKRLAEDKMTSNEVAQMIYRLLHKNGATVERGNYPTAQRLVNENTRPPEVGFVGPGPRDDVSVKSVFSVDPSRLRKMRKR